MFSGRDRMLAKGRTFIRSERRKTPKSPKGDLGSVQLEVFDLINRLIMRKFNEREQRIIELLCSIDVDSFDFIHEILKKNFFTKGNNQLLMIVNSQAFLYLEKDVFEDLEKRKREIYLFKEMLFLLQFLNDKKYISNISDFNFNQNQIIILRESYCNPAITQGKIRLNDNDDYFITDPPKAEIFNKNGDVIYKGISLDYGNLFQMISNNLIGLTFVSEELKNLVRNNFKTDEEKRFKKNFCLTWVGIIVAFLVGIFGLFNPFTSTVKIEKSQYKQAIQQIDELKDQLKTYESKIDSLKVQINNNARTQKSPL